MQNNDKGNINDCIDVSIIIVNYNSAVLLKNAVNSILDKTKDLNYEIIVVDNASSDGSGKEIELHFKEKIIYIQSPENIGFGRANNLAIKKASGTYIFFLNPDTILLNNALKEFLDFAKQNIQLNIGALGSLLLNEKLQYTTSFGTFPSIRNVLKTKFEAIIHIIYKQNKQNSVLTINDFEFPLYIDFITGADLFVPKKNLSMIGDFDSDFFMYCEETDLQKRMADFGFLRLIIQGPKIIHIEGGGIF